MHVIRVTPEEYEKIVPDRRVFFNEPRFCELNKDKVDQVHYLIVMKDTSARFGLILGQKGDVAKCPFSAPYSYPLEIRAVAKVKDIDEALAAIEEYCKESGIAQLRFTFPPLFYDEHLLSPWINAFYRTKYGALNVDINYSMNLEELYCEEYFSLIPEKGRKHLKKAIKLGVTAKRCETEEEILEAYKIIETNHHEKNRPVHLSFEQLMATMRLIDHDVFLGQIDGKSICAFVFYRISDELVECIYSGFLSDYTKYNGMNYLTYYIIQYYGERGFKLIDRATATEDSVPNYGLCDFKESVGAKRSLKYSFVKDLSDN